MPDKIFRPDDEAWFKYIEVDVIAPIPGDPLIVVEAGHRLTIKMAAALITGYS